MTTETHVRRTIKNDGPDEIDMHVGNRVRLRRKQLNLSQTALGKPLRITFQQVQKYENGANRIGAANLYKIARELKVDVAFFFEGLDTGEAPHDIDPVDFKLAQAFSRMRPDAKQPLLRFLKSVDPSLQIAAE